VQFKYAQNPETRRLAWEAYQGRLPINIPILEKMLALRRKITKLLGYPTWADYITEVKMTGSARAVQTVREALG
jgi:Zn-dependent oligopeptidase